MSGFMQPKASASFGQWVKKRRKALDLTQIELAKRVGCANISIQKIEANERRPSKQMALLLAEQLGIPGEERQQFVRFARGEPGAHHVVAFYEMNRRGLWNFSPGPSMNIPSPPTPLIGRGRDVAVARKRLLDEDTRLLTLVGPPGVGKTRLAAQIASSLIDEFSDDVYFVSLAQIDDPNLVSVAIAQTLGVNQIGERSFADRLKEYLCDKQMLLVLDNFEQVIIAASFIADLLSECPWLSILVTSRTPLSVRSERQFPVLPLTLPAEEKIEFDLSELMHCSAIELFVERAQAVRPDFALLPENADAVAAICKRLDGLPLAIELLAVRASFMTPRSLLEKLDRRTLLHADGLRDVSDRHHSLYHAIDWSYTLLAPEEQLLLARLSVFHGGWTFEAAEKIMGDQPAPRIQESLKSLVENNLVVLYEQRGESRFTLLETIRAYALERLTEMGEEAEIHQRHAEYYLALAEEADPHLRTSVQLDWLGRLEVERGNLRAALAWFIEHVWEAETGLRLAGALAWFWNIRCHLSEGREWSSKALQLGAQASPVLRARALFGAGGIAWMQGDVALARILMEESIAIYRDLGHSQRWDLAWALTGLAMVAAYQADHESTQVAAEEAVTLARQVGDAWMVALALCAAGEDGMMRQDYAAARSCFEESARIFRKIGDRFGLGAALLDWGYMDSIQGNYEIAYDRLEESITLFHQIGECWMRAIALNILGQADQQQGDYDQATVHYSESLDLLKKMGLETSIADVLYNLAQLTRSQGHFVLARRLYEECLALFFKQGNDERVAECRAGLAAVEEKSVR
jgi:predicted ATPase/transcriptional regulator with XRE-family HTH domain